MNTQSNTMHEAPLESQAIATPAVISPARRMYWSVRRELWENHSIYVAPLVVAVLFLLSFLISLIRLRQHMPITSEQEHDMLIAPYEYVAGLMMATALIVGIFYSLDALYGERRDRSILFWKSLPVSDVMTVLSKFTIPLVVLPLLSFAIIVAAQLIMLLSSTVVLLGSGMSAPTFWTHSSFFRVSWGVLYHLVTVHGLWFAPIYGWLMLVSAWAPRASFIWAFLPPVVICGVEKLAFNTTHFLAMLGNRVTGPPSSMPMTPGSPPMNPLTALIPGQFFSLPGLWIGLAIAALFLAAAVRLRRSRGPI
jgi:ABC-2 type transport system permease protein